MKYQQTCHAVARAIHNYSYIPDVKLLQPGAAESADAKYSCQGRHWMGSHTV